MINIHTIFNSSDNSGVKKAKCLGVLNNKKSIKINSICVAVVKSCKKKSKFIKKSDIIKTLITHTKLNNFNKYKSIKFHNNSVVVLNKNNFMHSEDSLDIKKNIKEASAIKLTGIIPFLIINTLSKFKLNLKKAMFV